MRYRICETVIRSEDFHKRQCKLCNKVAGEIPPYKVSTSHTLQFLRFSLNNLPTLLVDMCESNPHAALKGRGVKNIYMDPHRNEGPLYVIQPFGTSLPALW